MTDETLGGNKTISAALLGHRVELCPSRAHSPLPSKSGECSTTQGLLWDLGQLFGPPKLRRAVSW